MIELEEKKLPGTLTWRRKCGSRSWPKQRECGAAIKTWPERELEPLRRKKERVERRLAQGTETLLESYAKLAPEALEALFAEERHRPYRILQDTSA